MKRIAKHRDLGRPRRIAKLFLGEKRKTSQKSDKDYEFNVFYDPLLFKSQVSILQRKLQTVILIGQPEITSLHVIRELNNLKELWIVECNLKDVTSLEKNTSIEKLYLYSNAIEGLPDLSNMKRLKILSLARNCLSDLRGLRGLISLRDLNVADNDIHKIDKIFSPKCELSRINLSQNPINDFQDVENLFSLKSLQSIEFEDPLYGKCPLIATYFNYRRFLIQRLPSLREIDFHPIGQEEMDDSQKNEISFDPKTVPKWIRSPDLNFFSKIFKSNEFSHIKHLKIVECSMLQESLQDIFLPQLETLDLSRNLIESLQGLKSMKRLHTLCVSHNKIGVPRKDKTANTEKSEFPSMKVFYGDNNEITTIEDAALLKMSSLTYIFVQNNKIDNIKGIEDFPRLGTAVLDNNKIEEIPEDSFRANKLLKTLFLENNRLRSLEFARKLVNVEKLFLASNRIQSKHELVHLSELTKLTELTILGNPLLSNFNNYEEISEIIKSARLIDGNSR